MTEIVVTRGYPGSGKTTRAREWVKEDPYKRAKAPSRDDLRALLWNVEGIGTFEQEEHITKVQTAAVKELLRRGHSVIIDDTHLKKKYAQRWADIAANMNVGFSVMDVPTSVDKCLHRNMVRFNDGGRLVPPNVIRELGKKFPIESWPEIKPTDHTMFEPYVPDESKQEALIFDIDGTLAHMTGRSPYDYSRVNEDVIDPVVKWILHAANNYGARPLIVSGRKAECRETTREWLLSHGIFPKELFMRSDGDNRDDSIVKYEILRDEIAPNYYVLGVFDDRNRVVDMWRRIGLKCFQCAEGDF
ncbi:AAA family ATPase [Nocardia sp. NPDC059246]|uniref:phosphatase domain-containing protein n=1 Tax=unclassified Nocardia TaxID=2637762 RepID=UPI00367E9882